MRPFPALPEVVRTRYGVGPDDLTLRPFGVVARDLDVDFTSGPRPLVVTALIECCATAAGGLAFDAALFWELPVGRRVECLLALLPPSHDDDIHIAFPCGDGCGEESEIDVGIDELARLQDRAYASEHVVVPIDGCGPITLRRPTGQDQLGWLRADLADEEAATKAMLASLVISQDPRAVIGELSSRDALDRIDDAMEEHDPLIGFTVTTACPGCGATNEIVLDVEDLILQRLRGAQRDLLVSVHRLAAHYHWTEPEIFATPPWRRRQYMQLIEAERR